MIKTGVRRSLERFAPRPCALNKFLRDVTVMKRVFLLIFIIVFSLAGCAEQPPAAATAAHSSAAASDSNTSAAPTHERTEPPVEPDCAPEEINSVGAEAAYLLSGGRFAEQGGFIYYISGGGRPGLYKQGEEGESLIIQDELLKNASFLNIIGARLYFISDGSAYAVYTDSTGLEKLFEARALLAWGDKIYYIDGEGLKSYDASGEASLLIKGEFSELFMQFGKLFITRGNAQYGNDLLVCSDDFTEAQTVIEGCAFILSDGQTIYAETSSGICALGEELAVTEHGKLSFDLVPGAAASYDGKIYYCDRREPDSIYRADLEGNRELFFNRAAEHMWVFSGRLIYESDGRLMSVSLNGVDNTLLSEGLGGLKDASELLGTPSIEGIGNQALKEGQEVEVVLLLDGQPPEEKGLSLNQAVEGLKIVNTDNLIARLIYREEKLFLSALSEGSTVLRLETGNQSVEYLIRVVAS